MAEITAPALKGKQTWEQVPTGKAATLARQKCFAAKQVAATAKAIGGTGMNHTRLRGSGSSSSSSSNNTGHAQAKFVILLQAALVVLRLQSYG